MCTQGFAIVMVILNITWKPWQRIGAGTILGIVTFLLMIYFYMQNYKRI
jgi:hypothetical protein